MLPAFSTKVVFHWAGRSVCTAIAAVGVLLWFATSADAQLTARQLIAPAVSDYGPQYVDVEKAVAAFKEGDLKTTRLQLVAAHKKNPQLPPVDVMLAHLLFSANQANVGHSFLEKVAVEEPQDPEAFNMLGDLSLRQGRLVEAEQMFLKAEQLCKNYSKNLRRKKGLLNNALAGLAAVSEAQKNWELAVQRIEAWLAVDAKNANAHHRLGVALFNQQKRREAYAAFTEANNLDKSWLQPEVGIALLYEAEKNREKAVRFMDLALEKHSQDLDTQIAVIRWALDVGLLDRAAKSVSVAQKLKADDLQVQLMTGLTARYRNDNQQAMVALELALKQSPRNSIAMNHLALVLIQSSDEKQQVRALGYAHLNAQIHGNRNLPSGREAAVTLAWVLFRLGYEDRAENVLQAILNQGPINNESAYYIARIFYRRGRSDVAGKILQTALANKTYFPHRPDAEKLLAELSKKKPE